jgi:hypothetical protein
MHDGDDTADATNRRTLLLALGAAGVTGLAGCGGDDGDTPTDTEGGNGNGNGDTPTDTGGGNGNGNGDTPTDTEGGNGNGNGDTPTDTETPTQTGTPPEQDLGDPPAPLLSLSGTSVVSPDSTATLSGTLLNPYLFPVQNVELSVSTPEGWSVSPTDPQTFDAIEAGSEQSVSWELTVPADASGETTVTVDVSYESATDSANPTIEQTITVFTGDVPTSGLLAHYPLDGDTPTDASNNGNDATIDGIPDTGASGVIGGAYDFDGGFVDLPAFTPSADDSITVSLWVNADDLSSDTEFFFWGDGPPQFEFWYTGGLQFIYYDGSVSGITGGLTLNTGQWYHLAGTYDDSTGEWTVYVDGTEAATASGSIDTAFDGSGSQIGNHPNETRGIDGRIDGVRVYDRALSAEEVASLANQSSGS